MIKKPLLIVIAILVLSACASGPSKDVISWHDPMLDKDGGIAVIVDICIKKDEVGEGGDDDYFVIEESKAAARALLAAVRMYLQENQVKVRHELIPFVCGALHDKNNSDKKVAKHVNSIVEDRSQPFGINDALLQDDKYLRALSNASTYIAQYVSSVKPKELIVNEQEHKAASRIIADRTGLSGALYIYVAGTSISAGKSVGQFFSRVLTALVTVTPVGGGTNVFYIPGGDVDGRYMGTAAVNLETGEVIWSNGLHASGDPVDKETVADTKILEMLFYDLVHASSKAKTILEENKQLLSKLSGHNIRLKAIEPPAEYNGMCRGGTPIRTPQTIARYIQESYSHVFNSAEKSNSDKIIELQGGFNSIEFSSGLTDAAWDFDISFSTDESDESINIKNKYEFKSSFNGWDACRQTKEALAPAVQVLIKETLNNAEFQSFIR